MTSVPAEPRAPWAENVQSVLAAFSVDADRGLDSREAARRRVVYGRNQLRATQQRPVLSILAAQFKSVVVILLVVAGGLATAFSEFAEGLAIFAVIIINCTIGFLTEWRAVRSMEALRKFASIDCDVLRDGGVIRVSAEDLVPGDIVLLDAGDLVPADLRLIEAAKLQADESTLTGESLPVRKYTQALEDDTVLLDRHNMAFRGTAINRGTGKGVVIATGMQTEFGKIFEQVRAAEPQQTPLEKRLDVLGQRLAWAVIFIAILIGGAGILVGRELFLAIEVAIALSVAAIPEGLPIVATIALARGMWRMARRNALITRLSAVETLGATNTILTDKTGTLTENRMAVTTLRLADADITVAGSERPATATFRCENRDLETSVAAVLDVLLQTGVLCSNASLRIAANGDVQASGDPTELALLVAASARGIWRHEQIEKMPELREDAFDPDAKRMATLHSAETGIHVAVKGAPESIIARSVAVRTGHGDTPLDDQGRKLWMARAERLGDRGLRMLAIAVKTLPDESGDPYSDLVLVGIVGLEDPARVGVRDAISRCKAAGVSVVMVTGDHAATARNIAVAVGLVDAAAESRMFVDGAEVDQLLADAASASLLDARVFSRVTPQQKLKLIDLYQREGYVVAMTGDGVNDAPALKKADIGVAMGVRGTAIAKEASSMVLQDDEFSTIVSAIEQGRVIFANIRKFVVYLLSCNISEVLIVTLATIAGAPLPLLPLQILFLNLVTDVFPALALGVGAGSRSLMARKPRSASENLLTRTHWLGIAVHGIVISVAVLAAMAYSISVLNYGSQMAVTVSFCTLALAQMWHVFNMRSNLRRWINNEITRNVWIWIALATCLLLVLAAVYMPFLSEVLALTAPGVDGWTVIVTASLAPVVLAPFVRRLVLLGR